MKKLDDIPKKHPFTVPDDYFDKLPGNIQARVQAGTGERKPLFAYAVRYAIASATIAIVAAVWFWMRPSTENNSAEDIIASLDTSELVAYLNEGDITTDELLDDVYLDGEDVKEIEGAVFNLNLNDSDLNDFIDDID
ncbi:hypothetical protein WBG78_17855 [Chryseolinea sp. T2]|uniref:hypothetical protein n=1 Tax=Chryseolinea sp. T2 TaxID=3129255 RepID=UPI00307887D9